jgi:hypothetical protein
MTQYSVWQNNIIKMHKPWINQNIKHPSFKIWTKLFSNLIISCIEWCTWEVSLVSWLKKRLSRTTTNNVSQNGKIQSSEVRKLIGIETGITLPCRGIVLLVFWPTGSKPNHNHSTENLIMSGLPNQIFNCHFHVVLLFFDLWALSLSLSLSLSNTETACYAMNRDMRDWQALGFKGEYRQAILGIIR